MRRRYLHLRKFFGPGTRQQCGKARRSTNPLHKQLRIESLEDRRMLSITVNTLVDELDGSIVDGDISLRDAIAAATSAETIDFDAALNDGVISLALGQMTIANALTIDASSLPGGLTIDAGGSSRIFAIDDGNAALVDVELRGLTLTGGVENVTGKGGAISSSENLTIVDSIITGNLATNRGGGIWANGPVTITGSTFSDNSADLGGGAFVNNSLDITDSVFSGNSATSDGGGIRTNFGVTTIIEGRFFDNTADNNGGGIWSYLGASITDSLITGNTADNEGGGIWLKSPTSIAGSEIKDNTASRGGGIDSLGEMTIDDTSFLSNTATTSGGGGIYTSAPLFITSSTFQYNNANFSDGGAMWLSGSGTSITDSTVRDNSGYQGGAIFSWLSDLTINDSAIVENIADSDGGGIWTARSMIINSSSIYGNQAGGNGGGIWGTPGGNSGDTHITTSTIAHNWAGGDGGGIWFEDPMYITSSTISGNQADNDGGGVFGLYPLILAHSTINRNRADADNDSSGVGGGISGPNIDSTLDHTIVAGNERGIATRDDIAATMTATHSLIGDDTGAAITDNGGNLLGTGIAPIDARLALLADNGGFTKTHGLLFGSPALDAGDPGFSSPPDYDQRGIGFDRVTDIGAGAKIDMGAYENQTAPLEADLNLDGFVDGLDFGILAANFGNNGLGYADGNLNGDLYIDAADIGIMFGAWTGDSGPAVAQTSTASSKASTVSRPDAIDEQHHQDTLRRIDAEQQSAPMTSTSAVVADEQTLVATLQEERSNADFTAVDQAFTSVAEEEGLADLRRSR